MVSLRKYLSRAAGALALALTPGIAVAQSAPEPTPALWKVQDADTTIYMFGTVHVLPEDVTWMTADVLNAFNGASELVTEVDMSEMQASAQVMQQAAMIESGDTLRSMMTEENRAEYETALAGLGLPAEALDPVEPWFAALNLSLLPLMQAGYNPASGVELVFEAMAEGKSRSALETIEEQVALFDEMELDAQLTMLDATVEAVPQVQETVEAMVTGWRSGDADGLAEVMNASMDDPELYQRLLVARNANWVNWIAQRLEQPGNVFMAVGAGHLAGEGSVQQLLEERGYTVERVD